MMDDAETRRNLIFNTLAGLPKDLLEELRRSLEATRHRVPSQEMLDVLNELLGDAQTTDTAWVNPREKEKALDDIWRRACTEINRMVYAIEEEIPYGRAMEEEYGVISAWWYGLDVAHKEQALYIAGLWTR